MRIIAALSKGGRASFISHLDVQRTLQRAMRRADLPLRFSNGFNPHPEMHFATALSTGDESCCEWFDVLLDKAVIPEAFCKVLNAELPEGLSVAEAFEGKEVGFGSLTARLTAAEYRISFTPDTPAAPGTVEAALTAILKEKEIIIDKRTKGGMKKHDMRPQLLSARVLCDDGKRCELLVTGELTAAGGLRTEALMQVLTLRAGLTGEYRCRRTNMFFDGTLPLPVLPTAGVPV